MKKNDNPKVMVEFNLWGEFIDFDEFNRLLNVEPTNTKKKAEYKVPEYAHDTWELSTGYVETMAISVPFEALTSQLSREIDQINCLKEKYCLHSNLIVVIKSHINKMPECILTENCIKFASSTKSEIHFDTYIFEEN